MAVGLSVELENSHLLYETTSLFDSIAESVDLRFKFDKFIVIAAGRHHSPGFVATLQIASQFCVNYIPEHQTLAANFSIQPLRNSFSTAGVSSSFKFLHSISSDKIKLQYRQPDDETKPIVVHKFQCLPPEDVELEPVDPGKYFTVLSVELRRIIKELPLDHGDYVSVGVTSSQLKFSVGSKEIVLTTESGQCTVKGFEEFETELEVVLHPKPFFSDLTYKSRRIGFYKTITSRCVMAFPVSGIHALYAIYFPQI